MARRSAAGLWRRPRGWPRQSCSSACDQGAVSTYACAAIRRVRAVARTLRRKSPRANSCRPGARGTCARRQNDAALREAPPPLAHGLVRRAPASAARSLQLASQASTHMPVVQHVHMHAKHDAITAAMHDCAVVEEWSCAAHAPLCIDANASTRRAAAPRRRPAARGARAVSPLYAR